MRHLMKTLSILLAAFTLVSCNANTRATEPSVKSASSSKSISEGTTKTAVTKQIYQSVPILMYHSIAVNPKNDLLVEPNKFELELKHLHDAGYHTLFFKDLEDWKTGKPIESKPILITFDDGYKDNYTTAYPLLKKYNMKGVIFVVSNFVGDNNNHLSWENIQEMYKSGLIEFGGHTKSHLDLTTISAAKRHEEIVGSKNIIEEHIGAPAIAFAYPAGRYNNAVVKETQAAGYKFAVTTKPGYANTKQGWLTLYRVRIKGNLSIDEFKQMFP